MTATIQEIETIDLSDLEFERPCVPWHTDCGHTARWIMYKDCCTVEYPLCNEHRVWTLMYLMCLKDLAFITCKNCHTPRSWRPNLFKYRPIK